MTLDFVTLDVFTRHRFGGNPLAVVFDPQRRLDTAAMQAIAREFNLSETTFVQPPADPANDARVRIFTPASEMPWAGHPNVGTAWALALRAGVQPQDPRRWRFEEGAGLVTVEVDDADGVPTEARVVAPQALVLAAGPTVAEAARCLGLPRSALVAAGERVPVASVGFPFPLVEVVDREALRQARGDLAAMAEVLPPLDLDGVIVYTRDVTEADHAVFGDAAPGGGTTSARADLSVRMFAPLIGVLEDPATGSGVAALAAALAAEAGSPGSQAWAVAQGVDMGRPSALRTRVHLAPGRAAEVRVGGACVPVMDGRLRVG